jgi:hypothetical protein
LESSVTNNKPSGRPRLLVDQHLRTVRTAKMPQRRSREVLPTGVDAAQLDVRRPIRRRAPLSIQRDELDVTTCGEHRLLPARPPSMPQSLDSVDSQRLRESRSERPSQQGFQPSRPSRTEAGAVRVGRGSFGARLPRTSAYGLEEVVI